MLGLQPETRPRFRIANRSIMLFCVSVILISIGSTDYRTVQENLNDPERVIFVTRTSTIDETPQIRYSRLTPQLFTACGPAQLSGRAGLGNAVSKWLPWSQIHTGTTCRHVKFQTPFVNVNDIRLFLAVDRTASHRNSHLTPIVWAEHVQRDSFDACLHLKNDFDHQPEYWKEKVEISWWAMDTEAKVDAERKFLGRFRNTLNGSGNKCDELPQEANPHSHTLLIAMNHPGMRYERSYSYEGATHTSQESVVSWVEELNNATFLMCSRRLYPKTEGKIEDVNMDVISISRNKRYTGLTKIRLGDYGRGCVFVVTDLTKLDAADELQPDAWHIFVQARPNKKDIEGDGGLPLMAAWVEHKEGDGFTVCAKNLARGVHSAKHTIHIHWLAVRDAEKGDENKVCREGAVTT